MYYACVLILILKKPQIVKCFKPGHRCRCPGVLNSRCAMDLSQNIDASTSMEVLILFVRTIINLCRLTHSKKISLKKLSRYLTLRTHRILRTLRVPKRTEKTFFLLSRPRKTHLFFFAWNKFIFLSCMKHFIRFVMSHNFKKLLFHWGSIIFDFTKKIIYF